MEEFDSDTIVSLKSRPFGSLPAEAQRAIVARGRPRPPMTRLRRDVPGKNKPYRRRFRAENYAVYPWLCGSERLARLFCWPCVLFADESSRKRSTWTHEGYANLSGLCRSACNHSKSESHLRHVVDLREFERAHEEEDKDEEDDDDMGADEGGGEVAGGRDVPENRETLEKLVDVVCSFSSLGREEDGGNLAAMLNLLKKWDPTFGHLSDDVRSCLIDSIVEVMLDAIASEIAEADFVALSFEDFDKNRLSVILRYCSKNSSLKERFAGFAEDGADRSAAAARDRIAAVVKKYRLEEKLIAHDGAGVEPGKLAELQTETTAHFPAALFVPRHDRCLNEALVAALSDVECQSFFANLKNFLEFAPIREYVRDALPSREKYTARLVRAVRNRGQAMLDDLRDSYRVKKGRSEVEQRERTEAFDFARYLDSFETGFLLNSFSSIFAKTDPIREMLREKYVDFERCLNAVRDFIKEYEDYSTMTRDAYAPLLDKTESKWGTPSSPRQIMYRGRVFYEKRYEKLYRDLHGSIVDDVLAFFRERFSTLHKLEFVNLLDAEPFSAETVERLSGVLRDAYPSLAFDAKKLADELADASERQLFRGMRNVEILALSSESHHRGRLDQVRKLARLVCTLPLGDAAGASPLDRLRAYRKASSHGDLALLYVERELLKDLRGRSDFYDATMEKFVAKVGRTDLASNAETSVLCTLTE